jgi:hypothetical protein
MTPEKALDHLVRYSKEYVKSEKKLTKEDIQRLTERIEALKEFILNFVK